MSCPSTHRVYHVTQRGRRYGPLSRVELSTRVLTNDMLVWREGMTEWVPIATIEELRPYVRHAAAAAGTAPPILRLAGDAQSPEIVSLPPVPVPVEPKPVPSRLAKTIGMLNIGLGCLGLVLWPLFLVLGAPEETAVDGTTVVVVRPGVRLGNSVLTATWLVVSVPLLAAGIGLVRRRAWGRVATIASAWSCLLLQLAILALTIGSILSPTVAATAEADLARSSGGAIGGVLAGLVVTTVSGAYQVWLLVAMRSEAVKDSLH